MIELNQNIKYKFTAYFEDGKVIAQSDKDTLSDTSGSFQSIIDYSKKANLIYFDINDGVFAYGVDLPSGRFGINGTWFLTEKPDDKIIKRDIKYYIDTEHEEFCFGYTGTTKSGKKIEKVIRVS